MNTTITYKPSKEVIEIPINESDLLIDEGNGFITLKESNFYNGTK